MSGLIGRRVAHYQILEKLGEGGMGVVYKARDTHLDRFVAVKVLSPDKVADAGRKARFVQEAKAASALNHPNIVVVHDISADDGVDFIAMEYVAGKTLDQWIGRRGLSLHETLRFAIQISDAVARAHAAGIVHRDLKPSNVMVDEHGLVKVLDFGLAKLTEVAIGDEDAPTQTLRAATEEGTIVGTAAYMSPEQAEGKKVDARSDIFSFGALLYETVTGRRAFQGDSRMSTLSAVLHQEPKPLEDAPRDLERIIRRCLRKDPEKRFQLMKDLKVELEELKEDSDSQPKGVVARPARRRRRGLLAALVALPFLAAAGWLVLKYSRRNTEPPTLVQLTSYPGSETQPSFSPDGKQVAFTWDGEKGENQDIYVKLVGETNTLRLTADPAPEDWPAWSPDGKRIAFQRHQPGSPGIWSVSPLGGAEQKLAETSVMGQMSWSPDGKWLAVARGISRMDVGDVRGMFLVPADGGEPRRISSPKPPVYDIDPSFSPDGHLLAYVSCGSLWPCDVFVQALDAGYAPRGVPSRVTRQDLFIDGLAWSRDGQSLVYGGSFSWNMTFRLWRVESSGKQQPKRFDLAGFQVSHPAVAPAGHRLAFSRNATNHDIWRYQAGGVPEPFLASSLHEWSPQFSPDGSRIAFASGRAGETVEIWVANADGSGAIQLTQGVGRGQGTPRWSPDGRLIAFDSLGEDGMSKIYVTDASGGRPRRVSSGPSSDHVPSWSRDGKCIYFYSDRTGRNEVWRVLFGGGPLQQVTTNGGNAAFESPDGKTLFYTKGGDVSPLFAQPLDGGPERQILEHINLLAFVPVEKGIYYIGRPGPDRQYPIQYYEFATGESRLLVKVNGPLAQGLSVSPDRKIILFSKSATTGADLMLIENFR